MPSFVSMRLSTFSGKIVMNIKKINKKWGKLKLYCKSLVVLNNDNVKTFFILSLFWTNKESDGESKPFEKIVSSFVSNGKMSPFKSSFLNLISLTRNSACNFPPNFSIVKNNIIIFGPNTINFASLTSLISIYFVEESWRSWCR